MHQTALAVSKSAAGDASPLARHEHEIQQPQELEMERPSIPSEPLTVGMVEAMFDYLARLETELSEPADTKQRSNLGLPRYSYRNPKIAAGEFPSCAAQVKFVYISSDREKATLPGQDTGWRPASIVNDPNACRAKFLCFPNFVRQQFNIAGTDVVLVRNRLPYGQHHGLVRSALHEPQSQCFEPWRLVIALRVAKALGSRSGPSAYEVWVAGEGFNTQWHFHLQFRKQRSPIWSYLHSRGPLSNRQLLAGYPSRPVYFQQADEGLLLGALSAEASSPNERGGQPATGILISFENAMWRALLVKSRPTERVFGKPPGLHEHLGEVILENDSEFAKIESDVGAASRTLEERLTTWCAFQPAG